MNEMEWDKKLKINTIGRDAQREDTYHYPYEPTPYSVLKRLVECGYLNRNSAIVDYGCGKGRVGFFLGNQIGCRTVGVEYDERIYRQAMENKEGFAKKDLVEFRCMNAEDYVVEQEDCFYFFNPFSVEILKTVIGRILDSYYENPRGMKLFFYYPNNEYVAYLMTEYELDFLDEIDCRDLFDGDNPREKVLIFGVGEGEGYY